MVMREFKEVRPGEVSRAHAAAFLTDPLRMIRGVKDGNKKGKFMLDFVGKGGRPWREIQGQVRGLLQGGTAVPDYQIFCEYLAIARQLREIDVQFDPSKFALATTTLFVNSPTLAFRATFPPSTPLTANCSRSWTSSTRTC